MEIIKNFGINPYLLGAQVINFLILFFLLKKFAYKPILSMLDKRKSIIEKGLKDAKESQIAFEKAIEEEKKILKKAQSVSEKILSDSRDQAEVIADEMKVQTKNRIDQMLKESKNEMERRGVQMEKTLAVSSGKLAVEMVEKFLSDMIDKKDQENAIKKLSEKIKEQNKDL